MANVFRVPETQAGFIFSDPFVNITEFAPNFVGAISASSITQTGLNVNYTLDEDCTSYLIVVPQGSATPTPAQIKAGVSYGAVTVLFNASENVVGNVADSLEVTGITGYEGQQVTVYMTAEDFAANLQSQSDIRSVTVTLQAVNQPPVSSGNYPQQEVTVNTVFTFDASVNFTDDDTLTYSLSGLTGATIDPTTGVITWTPGTVGVYQGTVTATDQASQSASADLPVSVVGVGAFWDFSVPSDSVITFK